MGRWGPGGHTGREQKLPSGSGCPWLEVPGPPAMAWGEEVIPGQGFSPHHITTFPDPGPQLACSLLIGHGPSTSPQNPVQSLPSSSEHPPSLPTASLLRLSRGAWTRQLCHTL
ncbi:putative G-protein coupled receptor 176 [Platysternon megacephalum]|uniref:Putative G-protein coupled receptor 176 n=1 Tax=Platysternon megacephalum TaxID=55544 RepID=A0A4D9FBW3_9SAUR|nr:putative G-protein coupled receptor 176 [Platysternon megacephalum]